MASINVVADMSGDLFHLGHVNFLSNVRYHFQQKNLAIVLTVALHTDSQIEGFKGRRPVQSFESRIAVLRSCRYVDDVIQAPDDFSEDFANQFDYLVHGDDILTWEKVNVDKFYKYFIAMNKLILLPYTKGISTTDLIAIASKR